MTNNDILRRLRYAFNFNDKKMMSFFKLGQKEVSRAEMSAFLKKDDDADHVHCNDKTLAHFLAGFIIHNRGAKDGVEPVIESKLGNNAVLRKLKIALNMTSEDMMEIFGLVDFRLSKSELGAFFRKAGHKNYRECKDQVLRNFLTGLQKKNRPADPEELSTESTPWDS